MDENKRYSIEPIGIIKTCFPEKFGIPRQPSLAPAAKGVLTLLPPYNVPFCVEGLESCSHIWMTFLFHKNLDQGWKPRVRPPRLGGNKKLGVFATRSSFRPNGLGLSVARLERIETDNNHTRLHLSGVDLVDGTPVVDIKPYLPYADSVPGAEFSLAESPSQRLPVVFSEAAQDFLADVPEEQNLEQLIVQVLQQNPKPAYHRDEDVREYRMALLAYTVVWRMVVLEGESGSQLVQIEVLGVEVDWNHLDSGG